jgi:integrase
VPWQEVDLWNQQVTIGAAGDTKTGRHRAVNFTPELKGLLHEMNNTRAPDSSFLFPSPKRSERDIPTKSLRESFKLVRTAAGGYPPQGGGRPPDRLRGSHGLAVGRYASHKLPYLESALRPGGNTSRSVSAHFTPPKPPPRMMMRLVFIRREASNLPAPAS